MERIFHEQCEVQEQKVVLKTHAGSAVTQNPSDPDAAYDGHKGLGHHAQIAQACHPDNETQLTTSVLPQTAVTAEKALVLEDLQASGLLPQELLVDTLYPSDENCRQAEGMGVELVGPVPRTAQAERPEDLNIDDFVVDEASECATCCANCLSPSLPANSRVILSYRREYQSRSRPLLSWPSKSML